MIVLAGELLAGAEEFFDQKMHPKVIIAAYLRAMDDIIHVLENDIRYYHQKPQYCIFFEQEPCSTPIDINDREQMVKVVRSCIGTKLIKQWWDSKTKLQKSILNYHYREQLACHIALDAVNTVAMGEGSRQEIDIKRYAKVEKVSFLAWIADCQMTYFLGSWRHIGGK